MQSSTFWVRSPFLHFPDADPRIPSRPAHENKGIHLVVYCIDITDGRSFSTLEKNYRYLRATLATCPVMLLVCKTDLKKDGSSFYRNFFSGSSQIPIPTVAKYAKKANLDMHTFSTRDSDAQVHTLMDAMSHLVEYGRPRNYRCTIL